MRGADAMRMRGLVGLVAALSYVPLAASAAEIRIGNWKFDRIQDPITDQFSAFAYNKGQGGTVIIRCDNPGAGSLYMSFVSDKFLGGVGTDYDRRSLTYRFDGNQPRESMWIYKDNTAFYHKGIDNEEISDFYNGVSTKSKLAIRAIAYDSSYIDASFDLTGGDKAVQAVVTACKGVK
jgi:hypothetical protein